MQVNLFSMAGLLSGPPAGKQSLRPKVSHSGQFFKIEKWLKAGPYRADIVVAVSNRGSRLLVKVLEYVSDSIKVATFQSMIRLNMVATFSISRSCRA